MESFEAQYKCGKCGELGHNARSCPQGTTAAPKQISQPILSKRGIQCSNCGEYGHNKRSCSKVSGKTGVVETKVVSQPTTTKMPTPAYDYGTVKLPNGLKRQIQKVFPNRVERFEEAMKKIENHKMVKEGKIPFKWKRLKETTTDVPPGYIKFAEDGLLSGARKKGGKWVWTYVDYEIIFGDLMNTDFEYMGELEVEVNDLDPNNLRFSTKWFPRGSEKSAWAEPFPVGIEKDVALKIEPFKQKATSRSNAKQKPNLTCDKCNPEGDNVRRERTSIYMVNEDMPDFKVGNESTLEENKTNWPLKQYQLIEVGSGCEAYFRPIPVEDIAILYGNSRLRRKNKATLPTSTSGYGWSEMGLADFMRRIIAIERMMESLWLKKQKTTLWDANPLQLYAKGTYTYLNPLDRSRKPKPDYGIFLTSPALANIALEGRIFEVNDLPNIPGTSYMIQNVNTTKLPMQSTSSVMGIEERMNLDESDPDFIPYTYVSEVVVDDDTGLPITDEDGIPVEEEFKIPTQEWMRRAVLKGGLLEGAGWLIENPQTITDDDIQEVLDYVEGLDLNDIPSLILEAEINYSKLSNIQSDVRLNSVGRKNKDDASNIWRVWALGTYENRASEAFEKAIKARISEIAQEANISVRKYTFDLDDDKEGFEGRSFRKFLEEYTTKTDPSRPWSSRRMTVYKYPMAKKRNFQKGRELVLLMTPEEYNEIQPKVSEAQEKEEERKIRRAWENKRWSLGGGQYPTTYRLQYPYNYTVEEFLEGLGWLDAMKSIQPDSTKWADLMTIGNWTWNGREFTIARLTGPEKERLDTYMANKAYAQLGIAPSTQVAPQITITKQKLTQSAANARLQADAPTSKLIGDIGELLPEVSGYVAQKKGTFPDFKGYFKGSGEMCEFLTVVSDDGDIFQFVYPKNRDIRVGDYITIQNVKVFEHKPKNKFASYGDTTTMNLTEDSLRKLT